MTNERRDRQPIDASDTPDRREGRNPKDVPIIIQAVTHDTSPDGLAGVHKWGDRARAALDAVPAGSTGKVVLIVEDEAGTKAYSDLVQELSKNMSPTEAKAEAVMRLYTQPPEDQVEAERDRLFGILTDGFEGAVNEELDSLYEEYSPHVVDIIGEYQPEGYALDEVSVTDIFTRLVGLQVDQETKRGAFRRALEHHVPRQRSRGKNLAQIISEAADREDVVAVIPIIGSAHADLEDHLEEARHTSVVYDYADTHEGRHYPYPLTGLFTHALRNPNAEFSDQEIDDAFELEKRIRDMEVGLEAAGVTLSKQEMLAIHYKAFAQEKEAERGVPWNSRALDTSTVSAETTQQSDQPSLANDSREDPPGTPRSLSAAYRGDSSSEKNQDSKEPVFELTFGESMSIGGVQRPNQQPESSGVMFDLGEGSVYDMDHIPDKGDDHPGLER